MVPSPLTRRYFQDVDPSSIDPVTHATFVIERLLELGDEAAIAWLRSTFTQEQVLDVLRTDRNLTPLSANFWAILYGIPANDVVALRTR